MLKLLLNATSVEIQLTKLKSKLHFSVILTIVNLYFLFLVVPLKKKFILLRIASFAVKPAILLERARIIQKESIRMEELVIDVVTRLI